VTWTRYPASVLSGVVRPRLPPGRGLVTAPGSL